MKSNVRIVILAMSLIMMTPMIASAIIADIAVQFPELKESTIQLVLTLPALGAMISALVTGPASRVIAKKTISLFSLFAMFLGGLFFIFINSNFYYLLFAGFLIGMGQGGVGTITSALAADYFEGEECGVILGLQSAFVTGGGVLVMFIAGLLAGIRWNYSYLIFLTLVPIIILTFILLPKENVVLKVDESKLDGKSTKINSKVYFYCLFTFIHSLCLYIFITNVSLFVSNHGLGNATTSGIANTIMSAIGCLSGITYGRILRIYKNYILTAGVVVLILGYLGIYLFGNLITVFIAGACCGYAMSTIMPTALFKASSVVNPDMSATSIAMVYGSANVGSFLSPIIMNEIAFVVGLESIASKFLIGVVILTLLAVISILEAKHSVKVPREVKLESSY